MPQESTHSLAKTSLIIMLIASLGLNLFLGFSYWQHDKSITNLKNVLSTTQASSTTALNVASSSITSLNTQLADLNNQYTSLQSDYEAEKNRNNDFEEQISDLSHAVGTLDKLSKTDKELLQKYSKVYFLNENYIPSSLSDIPEQYILKGREPQQFHSKALSFLKNMITAAADDGVDLKVVSAYRSFSTQVDLKGQYTQVYGFGANAFSADQGYSEHQLGTAVDLTDSETDSVQTSFKDSDAYAWLQKNAYRYGFELSYPEGNGYYVYEPWHWRFVGTDLARDLYHAKANFYDWDQRKIDTYLVNIFD